MAQDTQSFAEFTGQNTSPGGAATATPNSEMVDYANQQLSYGQTPDQAVTSTYAKYPTSQGVSLTLTPDGKKFRDTGVPPPHNMSFQEFTSVEPGEAPSQPDFSGVTGGSEVTPESWTDKLTNYAKEWATNKQADTAQALGNIQSYFHNWEQKHQTVDAGQITPRERAAAKLLGMDLSDYQLGQWGQIYKMSPDERDQMDAQFQHTLGLTPEKTQARLEKTSGTDLKEFDPYGNILNNSLITHGLTQLANPDLANSRRYHEVQDMVHAMDVVENPKQHSQEEVKANADFILAYKKMNDEGVIGQLKDAWKEIKKNPLGATKGIVGNIASEPELLLAPEARIGTLAAGGREAAAVGARSTASRLASLASKVSSAAPEGSTTATASKAAQSVYERVAARAATTARQAAAIRHVGDAVGAIGAGAGINATSSALEQFNAQGYSTPGTLKTSALEGAAFGGIAHVLSPTALREDLVKRAQAKPNVPSDEPANNVNEGRKSGQPLHPDTTVSKDGKVFYVGGVDANMDRIHHDEAAPDNVEVPRPDGSKVNIPAKQTIGYHEAIEGPLIHLTGPVDEDTIKELQERIGPNHTLPPETLRKLRAGESLVYTNPDHEDTDPGGHEIATWAENHMVETLYGVRGEDYQKALKPAIKKVAENAKEPGAHEDIPPTLDTKPYDDVGQGDQLKGKGARPATDQVAPGAEENEDNKQKGKIDKRLLATGVVAGTGAAIGTATSDDQTKGAIAGGLAGLSTSALFWGGDIGVRGKYQREGGMFVGPKSRVWKGTDPQMADKMDKIGKTPDEITLATGLHRNAAGQWTKEISDKDMKLVPHDHPNWERAKKESIPLSTVMDHDKLDQAYPGLSDKIKIKINPEMKTLGSFSPDTMTITLRRAPGPGESPFTSEPISKNQTPKSIIAHEVQHVIQEIEGFPTGSNTAHQFQMVSNVRKYLEDRHEIIYQQILKAEREGAPKKEVDSLEEKYNKIQSQLTGNYAFGTMNDRAYLDYLRQAGEVQARNVQERLGMSEQERLKQTPRTTQDIDTNKQLIKYPSTQTGSVDPELLKRLGRAAAFGTVGAMVGAQLNKDNKFHGAVAGMGMGMLAGPLLVDMLAHPVKSAKAISTNIANTVKVSSKENISDSISDWQKSGLQAEVEVYRIQKGIERVIPRKESRIRVAHALDSGKTSHLTPQEKIAYQMARKFDDEMGQLGIKEGVLSQLINNHISHIWRNDAKLQAYKKLINSQIIANMSPQTAFAQARQLKSLAQGKAMGLTPVTEDVSEILGIYAKSVLQAIRNKKLLESLKNTKDKAGNEYLVKSARKAPYNYVPINHPQLRGLAVHPTIAPELRNVFHTYDLGPAQAVLGTLNMALKRSEVSFSLFHMTSLLDAYLGGMPTFTHPISTLSTAAKAIAGRSDFHKALMGTADPYTQALFDRFLASGARPQIARGTGADVDVNNDYYEALRRAQDYMDQAFPGAGKVAGGIAKVSHMMDHLIFENAMSGMKFALWIHAVDKLNEGWSKKFGAIPSQPEIDKIAGGFVNNLLGSQNWIQAADQATTRLGRGYLQALGSPGGRKMSQYLMYAPDWTTSTAMSLTKALGKGSGIKGLHLPSTSADLHRTYQLRSALIYLLIGNAINVALSGHYLWDNKDPTTIDMGNGQRLQWNKHWLEPYQVAVGLLRGNTQPLYNKLGILPHEALDQLFHKDYINTQGYSPEMKEGRLTHLAHNLVPIPFQNLSQQSPQQLMWNMAGRNVLGHPTQDKEWQEQEHTRKSEAAKKAAATRREKRRQKYLDQE